ncbi:MAG: flavin reductase family protein [Gammaproteobacteria bacterium]|nr:flavin reductase family protein [Gammaproteobacteria bacterium]
MTESKFDSKDLRRAFGAFATGVTIVTAVDVEGRTHGFTANSFTSVSLDPPLVLVCIAKTARGFDTFIECPHFAVNILSEEQREASAVFATAGAEKFAAIEWQAKSTGSPVLDGVAAWLDCVMHNTVDAGDHVILIGRVVAYDHNAEPPLGYCRGAYVSFGMSQDTLKLAEQSGSLRVGAIIERNQQILLYTDSNTGEVRLPVSARLGPEENPTSLLGQLAVAGIDAHIPFLFAAYDDGDHHCVYYRGEANVLESCSSSLKNGLEFVEFAKIPWNKIADPPVHMMLRRFISEREFDEFGVYIGDAVTGRVKTGTAFPPDFHGF